MLKILEQALRAVLPQITSEIAKRIQGEKRLKKRNLNPLYSIGKVGKISK
jgi:hypothetical protein